MAIVAEMEAEASAPEDEGLHPQPSAPGRAAVKGDAASASRAVSPTVLVSLLGGLLTAALVVMGSLMIAQMSSLGNSIDSLRAEMQLEISGLRGEIGGLRAEMRAEIGGLRAEMRAEMREEFARVHMVLLDHTDRLARLETAVGLPRADSAQAESSAAPAP